MEKNLKKNIIYIYITELLCYVPETNITLNIHYTSVNQPHKTIIID